VTRAPTDRSHLSIGEVLSLLQEEFPDVTISKIRFLESQGLLDPERTPSGYRKFYEADIDRLRWILRQQKEHYLPLKVIKDRLDEAGPVRTAPTTATRADVTDVTEVSDRAPAALTNGVAARGAGGGDHRAAVALDERPAPARHRLAPGVPHDRSLTRPESAPPAPPPPPTAPASEPRVSEQPPNPPEAGLTDVAEVIEAPAPRPSASTSADPTIMLSPRSPAPPAAADITERPRTRRAARPAPAAEPGAVSLTAEELIQASGLSARAVRELEGYGLLETHEVGDTSYYDADALVIARTAAGFLEHGIEARHIRSYKVAVEREAGLFEQIVLPLLKQRNPEAKRRATQTVAELMRLGDDMRSVLLRRGLRDHIPPP
jgi:DNA-binding transcriptional MerR regulator